ncbi:DUF928 domain-containing protein [Alkalinema pantanalense CENA528]|uniref:DUF928 domain-containing protein n=1 Tax=Alkalinema pantanalense TaxID=1620705 RepID=UPI003D6E1735
MMLYMFNYRYLLISLVSGLAIAFSISNPVHAQGNSVESNGSTGNGTSLSQSIQWDPPTPPNSGEPGGRGQGGGSRTTCDRYTNLQVIVPTLPSKALWGQTVSDRPTLWIYAPEGFADQETVEIVLKQPATGTLVKQQFKTRAIEPGITSIAFPDQVALKVGQSYQWFFSVQCQRPDMDDLTTINTPIILRGSVTRVALKLPVLQQLRQQKDPTQKAMIYAKQGIWFDALTTLGQVLRSPTTNQNGMNQDAQKAWNQLLDQAGFSPLNTVPVQPELAPVP